MTEDKRFLGLQYPLVRTAHGYFANKASIDQIKADMLQLLLTNPGERVMLPDYGTPLRKLIFEQNDLTLEGQARAMIGKSIQTWEPRVAIEDILVTSQMDENDLNTNDDKSELGHILSIKILFRDPSNIQSVEELKLEVPIGG